MSVIVPLVVPLTATDTPGNGSPPPSLTDPFITFCAKQLNVHMNAINNEVMNLGFHLILFFIALQY